MKAVALISLSVALCSQFLGAQEAGSGFDLRSTLSTQFAASTISEEPPRSGTPVTAGFRSIFYGTWKLSDHWTAFGAWQLNSRPYFYTDLSTLGYGFNGDLVQATLSYSRVSGKGSVLIRAGQLQTAFGSFPLRYDDATNPLVDLPIEYGYDGPVSTLGLAGAQIDASRGKWDGRLQFVNSSADNPRSILAPDQYGNWAGGGGYTIRQGFRIGASGFRGPYLVRGDSDLPAGELNPSRLPANALGIDVEWERGHWNVQGEVQRFVFPNAGVPTLRQEAGYAEVKRALNPRWYVAARSGFSGTNGDGDTQNLEAAAGFRPDRFQLIKADYELTHNSIGAYSLDKTFSIQVVTMLHLISASR
jgi:hypothetical protein